MKRLACVSTQRLARCLLAAASCLWLPVAQGNGPDAEATRVGKALGAAGGGSTQSSPASAPDQVQVVAEKGSSAVAIKMTRNLSKSRCASGGGAATFDALSLQLSSPLNKDADSTTSLDLDGLVNSASVELQFGRTSMSGCRNPFSAASTRRTHDELCKRAYEVLDKKTGKVSTDTSQCDDQLIKDHLTPEEYLRWERLFFDERGAPAVLFGGSAKLGRQDAEYVDAATATKVKQSEGPWSVGAFVAFVPDGAAAVYALRARYQRTWSDAKAGAVCPLPAAGASTVTCATGAVGPPAMTTKKLLSIEARWELLGRGVGMQLTRDFEAKVSAVEMPIYLIQDKDGKLTGGVRAGWRSDTRKFAAGVFVGVPFDLP